MSLIVGIGSRIASEKNLIAKSNFKLLLILLVQVHMNLNCSSSYDN